MSTVETHDTGWIGVAEVAAEMGWTKKAAYEEVRRLGVPCRGRGVDGVRFRRSDYETMRDSALAPLPPRKAYAREAPPAAPPRPAPPKARPARLSKLRGA